MAKPTADDRDREFGRRLRERRIELGLSQSEIGRHVGATYQTVQSWESGSTVMAARRIFALAQALQVEPGYFFESEQTPGVNTNDESRALAALLARIDDRGLRRSILRTIEVIADGLERSRS